MLILPQNFSTASAIAPAQLSQSPQPQQAQGFGVNKYFSKKQKRRAEKHRLKQERRRLANQRKRGRTVEDWLADRGAITYLPGSDYAAIDLSKLSKEDAEKMAAFLVGGAV